MVLGRRMETSELRVDDTNNSLEQIGQTRRTPMITKRLSSKVLYLSIATLSIVAPIALAQTSQRTAQGSEAASGQPNNAPVASSNNQRTPNETIITGQPFSAIKYQRTVNILPDGTQALLSQRNIMELARDAEGRIRSEAIGPDVDCPQPAALVPPSCPVVVVVFDPTAQIITHWPEGERAGPVAVIVKVSPSQIEDAENSTSAMPEGTRQEDVSQSESDGNTVTTENLKEKVIEGIRATGFRTTTVIPAGHADNKKQIITIHEVWFSASMKLVIKIVDGDPKGKETISGLEHFSLSPDPALFQPPAGYEIQHRDRSWPADVDMPQLAEWQVK